MSNDQSPPKKVSACIEQLIPFHDVDMGEIVWHGHYVRYIEIARCELLDKVGYGYQEMADSSCFWPIVNMRIKYLRPAVFGQKIQVKATLEEWEYRLRITYEIRDAEGTLLTEGLTDQVPLDKETREMMLGMPSAALEKIEQSIKNLE